jgi:hypothetical protein
VVVLIAVALTIYFSGDSLMPKLLVIGLAAVGICVILLLPKAE